MPDDTRCAPRTPDDAIEAGLTDLLAGPFPANLVHGAIELAGHDARRPSQACIDAAREDILAALWGTGR